MADDLRCNVYLDWNLDGTFEDDISAYWKATQTRAGLDNPDKFCASAGRATVILNNADQRFSPDNATGPYYGDFDVNIPIKITATDGVSEWALFRGEIESWEPKPGAISGDRTCVIVAKDLIGVAANAGIALPLQIQETAKTILDKVSALAFDGDFATNSLQVGDGVTQGDQVTVGDETYTFVGTLTGASNEVLIAPAGKNYRDQYSARNLARAISAGDGAGVSYGAGTVRNKYVTAHARSNFGVLSTWAETWIHLRDAATNYEFLADDLALPTDEEITFSEIWVYMKKTGSPTGTLTLNIETKAYTVADSYHPSGTLIDANATGTVDESTLTTGGGWVVFTLDGEVTLNYYQALSAYITLTTDRGSSGTNYVSWGWVASTGNDGLGRISGSWGALTGVQEGVIWFPPTITLLANAPGTWANALGLSVTSTEWHSNSLLVTVGSVTSGTVPNSLFFTQRRDENRLQLAETTGTPAFNYRFLFSISGTAQTLVWYGRYTGTHNPIVQIYDSVGVAWDTIDTLNGSSAESLHVYDISDPKYTSVGGNVFVRFYHAAAGSASHSLLVNHLYVISDTDRTANHLTVGGANFSGGTDAPSGLTDFATGETFPLAADGWSKEDTTGLSAYRDVARSEYGLFWAEEDGTLRFEDYQWFFQQIAAAADLTLSSEMNDMKPMISRQDVANEIVVEYIPRREVSGSVVASANGDISVPARQIGARVDYEDAPDVTATVRLKYIEGATGNVVGAKDIIAPVAGTDYSVWTTVTRNSDGSITYGQEVTDLGVIVVTLAVTGGDIEATFENLSPVPLVVTGFQLRGTALVRYDRQQIIRRDDTSIAKYGKQTHPTITLLFPADRRFAEAIAEYELNRRKDARMVITGLVMRNQRTVGGTHLYSLMIGNVVSITEAQTGISAVGHMILGKTASISKSGEHTLNWVLRKILDPPAWILGDSTYGVLGSTTYLGL